MNQLFRLVQMVIPIFRCKKKFFLFYFLIGKIFWLLFCKKKYIWSTKISFGDSPAETKKK